jgi:hypothetical protein
VLHSLTIITTKCQHPSSGRGHAQQRTANTLVHAGLLSTHAVTFMAKPPESSLQYLEALAEHQLHDDHRPCSPVLETVRSLASPWLAQLSRKTEASPLGPHLQAAALS